MDFALTEHQRSIDESVRRVCAQFEDTYWLDHDRSGDFPIEFRQAMTEGGWLGIAMPERYGGAGLGITEAAVLMHAVTNSGGAMSAASTMHINIFGPHPIVVYGDEVQRERWLPPLIAGKEIACFAVTEPDAGSDTGSLTTQARLEGDHYVVRGRKIWTSTAQVADRVMLLARTGPREAQGSSVDGLTLFYTRLDRDRISVREIDKMGRKAVDSNELFIDDLIVPVEDRIGEEGKGFRYLLDGLNPERILIAAEAVGIGRNAVDRAARYARERVVFGRPIGQNQAIQHPLARSWAELEAGWLLALKAAWAYDAGEPSGAAANAAKYFASEVAFTACERAVMTHGGMGYAKEFQVERLLREVLIPRIAPVSQEMVLCYLAERVLDLPRSY